MRERLQEQFDPKELRGYEAEQVNVVDLIEANAAWKKNTGKYPKGYKDPEYLRSNFKGQQMDEQTKIKRLIEHLNTLERAPKLLQNSFIKVSEHRCAGAKALLVPPLRTLCKQF